MEERRRPRKSSPSRKSYEDDVTQTRKNFPVPEICGLCQKRALSGSSPNDIHAKDNLPDNICQCFFSMNVPGEANVDNVPGEANVDNVLEESHFEGEQNAGKPNVQICDSRDANLDPVKEESRTEEFNNASKNDASSGEESKLPEYSFSSNGHTSSPNDDQSFNPLLPYRRTVSSDDKSFKNSQNAEKSPRSNGYALSLREQSFDQNLSDHRNIASPISERCSKNSSSTEKGFSSGYPSSLGEQSPNGNFRDRRKSTSSSSGEDSKRNFNMGNGEESIQRLNENNLQLNISERKFNKSFSSDQGEQNDDRTLSKCYYQHPLKVNRNANVQYDSIPTELAKFRFESPRPILPPPFFSPLPQYYPRPAAPTYQPHRNPAINMSMSRPSVPHPQHHTQPIQSCGNPVMNMPLNRTDIPGRYPVSRPQMSTSYHRRPDNDVNASLSKKSFRDAEEDPEIKSVKTNEKVQGWLETLPNEIPVEEASASGCEMELSTAENEENEGMPPCPSEIFTDERSSTELSEEENRRQRSLRRPPRKNRK